MKSLRPFLPGILVAVVATCVVATVGWSVLADEAATDERLLRDIKYLASDELEGRGIGSKGLDQAADYLRDEFQKAGLDVTRVEGGAFQPFTMTTGSDLGSPNTLEFTHSGGEKVAFELNKDYRPMSFGGAGKVTGEVVFVGYGIKSEDPKFDEYEGIDVTGKTVVVVRRVPDQGNPHGSFAGHTGAVHESLLSKANNAASAGAAAIIFVSDSYSSKKDAEEAQKAVSQQAEAVANAALEVDAAGTDDAEKAAALRKKLSEELTKYKVTKAHAAVGETDPLLAYGYGGHEAQRSIPIFHATRAAIDKLLKPQTVTVASLESEIAKTMKPHSMTLAGWKVEGESTIERKSVTVKNVIGVLEGEGPLADETIVIGAHYDHVGRTGVGSLAAGPQAREIHNGADDNASGTVSLIELARKLAARPEKPKRRLVFIAFTAEESGLIGSAYYVKNPVFPLGKTVAMFNMDMVGRLKDDKLTIFGTGTSPIWDPLIDKLQPESKFVIARKPEGFGPSDQSSFYKHKIPVLHYFTNTHSDYHRPGDDWEKINISGMRRVVDLLAEMVEAVASTEKRPEYVSVQGSAQIGEQRQGSRPYFGSIPDFSSDKPGYLLGGVAPGSPADKGGLKAGDLIVQVGMVKVENLSDFDLALRKFSAGDVAEVTIMRGTEKLVLKVVLDKPR